MKVRILKSKYIHTWYAKMLGKTFDVVRECEEYFWVSEPDGNYLNIIFKDDAVKVPVDKYGHIWEGGWNDNQTK